MTDFVRKPFGLGAKNNVLRVLRKIEGFMLKFLYPNITGAIPLNASSSSISGAFFKPDNEATSILDGSWYTRPQVCFDASLSDSIYGLSHTIQVASIRLLSFCRI